MANKELVSLLSQVAEADISYSFHAKGVEERLTLYFELLPHVIDRLAAISRLYFMPEAAIEEWRSDLEQADLIGVTVNRQNNSFRLYSQSLEQHRPKLNAGDLGPFEIYQGYKSLGQGAFRHDRYICTPLAQPSHYEPQIRQSFRAFHLNADALLHQISPPHIIWAEIHDAGRISWLATLHYSNIPKALSEKTFAPLSRHDQNFAKAAAERELMHMAGGNDPLKGNFLTLYFSAEEPLLSEFLRA